MLTPRKALLVAFAMSFFLGLPQAHAMGRKASASCPAPTGDAATLFTILEGNGTGSPAELAQIKTFLATHVVAVDALNAGCETSAEVALRKLQFDVFAFLYQNFGQPDLSALPAPGAAASIYVYVLWYGTADMIATYKSQGGNTSCFGSEPTDLMVAAERNTSGVVDALLREGAAVNQQDNTGETPLMYAASENSDPAVLQSLIRAGARIDATDQNGDTALMYAAMGNTNGQVAQALIRAGAQITLKDGFGNTPLALARRNHNPNTEQALEGAGEKK
jgi:hypothetical protein